MKQKGQHQTRTKATLHVEALEERMSPAIITEGVAYIFRDAVGGDSISVTLTGRGSAEIVDAAGGDPRFAGIAHIYLSGTNNRTVLTIADTNPGAGGDTLSLGSIEILGGARAQMGEIVIDTGFAIGTVSNTFMWGGQLNALTLRAATMMTSGFLFTGATTNRVLIAADMVGGSFLNVTGNVNSLVVVGDVDRSTVTVGRNASELAIGGRILDSTVTATGNVTLLHAVGGMQDSSLSVTGNVRDVWVAGGMTAAPGEETRFEIGGSVRQFNCFGVIDNSTIAVGGNVSTFQGTFQLQNGATLDLGAVNRFDMDGWMNASQIVVRGRTATFRMRDSALAGSLVRLAGGCGTCAFDTNYLSSTLVVGGTARSITITGIADRSFIFCANLQTLAFQNVVLGTNINVSGNARTIQVAGQFGMGGGRESTLVIGGNVNTLDFRASIVGDADPVTREIDVEGTLRLLSVAGSMTNSVAHIGGNATTVTVMGNLTASVADFGATARTIDIRGNLEGSDVSAGAIGALTVGNAMRDSASVTVVNDVGTIAVTNGVDRSFVWIFGSARSISIGGSLAGSASIMVSEELRALTIGGNLGGPGAADSGAIQAGDLRRADVTGLIFGSISVTGRLGDIFTAGQDAVAGAGAPPGGMPPFTGWFRFATGGGVLTGGYVQYVTWGGRTVS